MNKIELEISDIAPSGSTSGAYALVLSEVGASTNRKLPIVIGGHEAQAIAIELEKMTPSRPLTHDLFKSFSHSFGIEVEEVIIYNLIEGIFFAKLIATQDGRKAEIDSRTSDAVALAVRFNCPIYCFDFILDSAGVTAEEADLEMEEETATDVSLEELSTEGRDEDLSLKDLEKQLAIAIEREEYERASKLRDEIERRKSQS